MLSISILAQSGALESIIESLPTDPAALFTLGLTAVAFIAVVVVGRKKGKGSGPSGGA